MVFFFKNAKEGKAFNKKQLEEDKKFLEEVKQEDIAPRRKSLTDEEANINVRSLETELDDAVINQFKMAQKTSKNKEIFDGKIENLDLTLNFKKIYFYFSP